MPDLKPNEELCRACGGEGTIDVGIEWCMCGWCAGEGKIAFCSEGHVAEWYRCKIANLKAILKNNEHLRSTRAELEECERFLERELNKEGTQDAGAEQEEGREHRDRQGHHDHGG